MKKLDTALRKRQRQYTINSSQNEELSIGLDEIGRAHV